jgi:hypothetical protein
MSTLAGSFDLDKYVVDKTLDGLFYVLGQEEQKIRNNPAARTNRFSSVGRRLSSPSKPEPGIRLLVLTANLYVITVFVS